MNHKEAARQLKFSVDLCQQAAYHVAFLKAVDAVTDLKKPHNLKRALYRYEKYWLPLAAEHSKDCLSAPLDIEWIWHCHMLCPKAYEADCQAIVGSTVNHTLRDPGKFTAKQDDSKKLWSQKYGNEEPFTVDFQAPYNSESIDAFQSKVTYDVVSAAQRQMVFYYQVSLPHYVDKKYLENSLFRYKQFLYLKTQLPKEFLVPCYDIDLMWHTHQLNPLHYKTDMIKIIGKLLNHDDTVNDRSVGSKLYIANIQTRESWTNFYKESHFLFGAMYRGNSPVEVLYKITSEDCYSFATMVGSKPVNMLQEIESAAKGTGGKVKGPVGLASNVHMDVNISFEPPRKGKVILFLEQGIYKKTVIPENIQSVWGPVSLERLPPDTDNHCQVASHKLKNHLGHEVFTVRTIHSQHLMMSVIQVFYHDKLAVVGHLIALDQLPLPTQVSKNRITLNPKQGERGVLLKSTAGDWGILTGRWGGFKRGVAGTCTNIGVRGSPGTLHLRFHKMSTGKTSTLAMKYPYNNYELNLESASVDLMKGIIQVDTARNEVAENIALAFAVSLLHVLCVPRQIGWKEGMQIKSSVTTRVMPSDDMAFIMAAGLLRATPSNFYMHLRYGDNFGAVCRGGVDGSIRYVHWDWGNVPGGEPGCDGTACGVDGGYGECGGSGSCGVACGGEYGTCG